MDLSDVFLLISFSAQCRMAKTCVWKTVRYCPRGIVKPVGRPSPPSVICMTERPPLPIKSSLLLQSRPQISNPPFHKGRPDTRPLGLLKCAGSPESKPQATNSGIPLRYSQTLLVEAPVGCLFGLLCAIVQFPGSGPEGLQMLVPPLYSWSRTHCTWRAVVLKRCE